MIVRSACGCVINELVYLIPLLEYNKACMTMTFWIMPSEKWL